MNIAYPYTLEPQEDGGYLVQFIDLENAFTEGETPEEAALSASLNSTTILEEPQFFNLDASHQAKIHDFSRFRSPHSDYILHLLSDVLNKFACRIASPLEEMPDARYGQ